MKNAVRHIHFAAHFYKRQICFQTKRYCTYSSEVGGYIFAHRAVTPCRPTNKYTVAVFERNRQPVDFRFNNIGCVCYSVFNSSVKISYFVKRKGILQAFHFYGMGYAFKHICRFAADSACGGVRCYKLRIFFLYRF